VLIIVLAYLAFGLKAPVGGVLLSLVIVALTAVTLASASYAVALTIKSEQAFPALRDQFKAAHHPVTWVPFDGGHGIPGVVLDQLQAFLAANGGVASAAH